MKNLSRCKSEFGDDCFFCQSSKATLVHYVNGNRSDDSIDNMRPCCPDCLKQIHSPNTNYIEWSKKLENPPIETPDSETVREMIDASDTPYISVTELSEELDVDAEILQDASQYAEDISVDSVTDVEQLLFLDDSEYDSEDNSVADEFVTLFPDRAEIVAGNPSDKTATSLSKVAHLEDMNEDSLMYGIEKEDVWNSPFNSFKQYVNCLESTVDEVTPRLEERLRSYWDRSDAFKLETVGDKSHLIASDEDVFKNVAKRKLEHNKHYTKFVDDKSLQVTKDREAHVKKKLYEEGYLVEDRREIEDGESVSIKLDDEIVLRDYQRDWVENFLRNKGGTFVGPSGSGKTVATIGVMSELDQETLIIVPKRELAQQWEEELVDKTNLSHRQIGQYHGGEKNIRPVTIATYDTARKSRHRKLFNSREWGLLVLDEAHHSVAPVWERVANIQSKSRLGLTATPVRESGNPEDIYSLIGPPVGTDWHKLFRKDYVQKPEVVVEKIPWSDESKRERYERVSGHMKRRLAAENPAKLTRLQEILQSNTNRNVLVFVEWVDQGEKYEEELGIPFVYGETPHDRREELFQQLRDGDRSELIISRVGDEGIDIPNIDVCVICSTLGSSSSQTAQRIGRTMRPTGSSEGILLATKGSNEEDFVRSSTEYLAEQGIEIKIMDK